MMITMELNTGSQLLSSYKLVKPVMARSQSMNHGQILLWQFYTVGISQYNSIQFQDLTNQHPQIVDYIVKMPAVN